VPVLCQRNGHTQEPNPETSTSHTTSLAGGGTGGAADPLLEGAAMIALGR